MTWTSYIVGRRFEHHDGTKVVQLTPDRKVILSHGWKDSIYVHMWEVDRQTGAAQAQSD